MAGTVTQASVNARRLLRSGAALLFGTFVGAVLSLGTDQVLHSARIFPPWGQPMADVLYMLAAAYRIVYNIVDCYIVVAPGKA